MPLTVQRYNVTADGQMVAADNGALVTFADASRAYDTLDEFTKTAVAAKDAGAKRIEELNVELREAAGAREVAVRDLDAARSRVASLEQGIRQAQVDLGYVYATDMGTKKAELEQKIRELQAALTTLA